jgi:hypothetical protein
MSATQQGEITLKRIAKIITTVKDVDTSNKYTCEIAQALMKGSNGKYYVSACGWGLDEYYSIPKTINVRPSEIQADAVVGHDEKGVRYIFVETKNTPKEVIKDMKETWEENASIVLRVEIIPDDEVE